jgi:uncharacterized membrane protein YphA (DoxX/SURF4 family)
MIFYGWPKVKNLKRNSVDFIHMGYTLSWLWNMLIMAIEFFGGIMIVLGLFASITAALFSFQMIVGGTWKKKHGKPFGEYSYDLLFFRAYLHPYCFWNRCTYPRRIHLPDGLIPCIWSYSCGCRRIRVPS